MKRLSVILPVYNVEEYLEKCIRSLEEQDIPKDEYEIICVNDGSPDNSREVIIKLQKEFDNLILIDQVNMGVSMARNRGIEEASGKYLIFIDPDDLIQNNILGEILKEVISTNAQIAIPGYALLDENEEYKVIKKFDKYQGNLYTGIDAFYISHNKAKIKTGSVVGFIIETDFIIKNNLRFPRDVIINQDEAFLSQLHCLTERNIFLKQVLYIIFVRKGSTTRSNQFNTERVRKGFILAANYIKELQEKSFLSGEQKTFLNGPIIKFVLLTIYSAIRTKSIKIFKTTVNDLYKSGYRKLDTTGCSRFNRICGGAYNISPYLGAVITVVYQRINYWFFIKKDINK